MNDSDSSKLQKIYLEKVIQEINLNPDADFGDSSGYKFGRHKGRHFQNPELKPNIPQSRKEYIPSSEREPEYTSEEYPEIFDKEAEEVKAPHRIDLNNMDRDTRREFIALMSSIRQDIDDISDKNPSNINFKSLSLNRKLMDDVIADIVLGFAEGNPSQNEIAGLVADTEYPTFYAKNRIKGEDVIEVRLPYGPKTNHEDVKYIQLQ